MFASSPLDDRSLLRTHRHTLCLSVGRGELYKLSWEVSELYVQKNCQNDENRNSTIVKNYFGITQRLLPKAPPPRKPPAARKYFLATSQFVFVHKILSLIKLVPLICPGGAGGPLLATRL